MNEKEMIKHINALTKIIEKHFSLNEQLIGKFNNMDRQIAIMSYQVRKLEGIKDE